MTSKKVACLFPGQGAHHVGMLDGVCKATAFAERYALVCDALGEDVLDGLTTQKSNFLNRNEVSSLLTVLVSTLSYDLWQKQGSFARASYLAGYSVGQWTALYAAGALSFEMLVKVVKTRALIMNRCLEDTPSGMIAVIGLSESAITLVVQKLQDEGYFVELTNFNCLGQYSLAASAQALQPTVATLQALSPKKVVVLPVAGAWHSSLLRPAEGEFAAFLSTVELAPLRLPVVDNVTGGLLPTSPDQIKIQLTKHLSHPVLWQKGIETLIDQGCEHFIEVGYGKLLTKFGFFINRSYRHLSFYS